MTTYVEVARKLAVPTAEQTQAFAQFVTGAHSWYKHLKWGQPSPFVFFLDPNAGRAMVHVTDDEVAFVDNTDKSKKFHYTWQTTESYRRRFEYWDYEASYGKRIMYQSAEGIVDTAGAGLRILDREGGWVELPRSLAEDGTALVSSLMYAPGWGSLHAPDLIQRGSEITSQFSFVSPLDKSDGDPDRYYAKLLRVLPKDIVDALRPLQALWADDIFQREKAEIHRPLDDLHHKVSESGRAWDEATKEMWSTLYRQKEAAWEQSESRREERELLEPLIAGIVRERARQISGMVNAMTRFLASLHAAGHA